MTNPSSEPTQNTGFQTAGAQNAGAQKTETFYDLLGLRPNASVQDIRRAYRDLSKLYHPDTTELDSAIAVPKFQALNEAYATLSSPEKRITYDYKTGFSRLSVMQPLATPQSRQQNHRQSQQQSSQTGQSVKQYTSNAYIDPTDRPLSAGEFFALFILGITFVCCLILVITLGMTRGDTAITRLQPPNSGVSQRFEPQADSPPAITSETASTTAPAVPSPLKKRQNRPTPYNTPTTGADKKASQP
ncbi:MAG: J domain-containing protein, partial [Cyanobacteria bacterium J06635_11]